MQLSTDQVHPVYFMAGRARYFQCLSEARKVLCIAYGKQVRLRKRKAWMSPADERLVEFLLGRKGIYIYSGEHIVVIQFTTDVTSVGWDLLPFDFSVDRYAGK